MNHVKSRLSPASTELTLESTREPRENGIGSDDSNSDSPAVELGRRGGVARARKLSSERRIEIARNAAARRWGKVSP